MNLSITAIFYGLVGAGVSVATLLSATNISHQERWWRAGSALLFWPLYLPLLLQSQSAPQVPRPAPTNDLDADTLDLLQETLDEYDGTVLLVSHDRDFLDRLVTSTIAMEGDGTAIEYAGGYSDYLLQRPPPKEAVAVSRVVPRADTPTLRAESRRKLSYKQQRALDELPQRIETLQAEIAALNTRLADATLYARDAVAFNAAMTKLSTTQAALTAAESGAETIVRCGRCNAVRGTLDQLHSLARASTDPFEM